MDPLVLTQLLVQAAGVIVILIGAWLWTRKRAAKDLLQVREDSGERIRRIEEDTQREVARQLKEAEVAHKAESLRQRREVDEKNKARLKELQDMGRRIANSEESLDKRRESLDAKEESVQKRDSHLGEREEEVRKEEARYKELQEQEIQKLEEISGMSAESAKKELMARYLEEAKIDIAGEIDRIEREAKENVDQEAKKILALSVERFASDHVAETTISVVDLPTDEMKGRIIGREGRNIRALEMATGVDIIIDDTPEAVVVSGFDKIRRETARLA
ncbi:MAG: Rnase Y domain-containing protein, partial [Nitrospinota bacterium]|nr:Rnase Y domain-containing protein [Nitrospinota bacterium]